MVKTIQLTQGKEAIVDDIDYAHLSQFKWHYKKTGYVARGLYCGGKMRTILMHREIMNPPPDALIDHIDGDKLNNCRSNLRIATNQQNQCNRKRQANNTSGYKGVCWSKQDKKWCARIRFSDKRYHLGFFDTPEAAHKEYCAKSMELHGKYGRVE